MNPLSNMEHFRDLVHAIAEASPMIAMIRPQEQQFGVMKELAIALIIPVLTAAITAMATAYVTQAVLAEQMRQMEIRVEVMRQQNEAANVRLQQWIIEHERSIVYERRK